MTEIAHIQESAAGMASLPPDDPERLAAYAHAGGCAECARALRQAESFLAALDAVPSAPAPPARTLRAMTRAILTKLSALAVPTRLLSAVIVLVWILLVVMAKRRAGGGVAWAESIALVAAALAALALFRRLGAITAGLAVGASALMAALAWGEGSLAPRVGMACLLTELGAAVVPIGIVARTFVKRRSANPTPGLVLAAVAGALVGQAALHLTCPQRTAGLHILAFHFGGVILAGFVAALIARLIARPAAEAN